MSFDKYLTTHMTNTIHNMFLNSFKKEWYETYWLIDVHGTICKSTYDKSNNDIEYYAYAKEAMQMISNRKDIVKILWTSSTDEQIKIYNDVFLSDNIRFNHINENPNISSRNGNFGTYDKKLYFNILIDDKAGFNPNIEWKAIYELFQLYEYLKFKPNENWTTKF